MFSRKYYLYIRFEHETRRLNSLIAGGYLTLASSDPFAKPVINPKYLTSDFDVFTMVQAIKDMQNFISSDPWKDVIVGPVGALANATTDEELELYARNASISINHSIGTARMSPFDASWGVVDPDLLVKGTRGLSVVDASVFVRLSLPIRMEP